MRRPPVEHFVSGLSAWKLGALGFLVRLRGIGLVAILGIVAFVAAITFPSPSSLAIPARVFHIGTVVLLVALILSGLGYLRYRTRRSLKVKHLLHRIVHDLRDHLTEQATGNLDRERGQLLLRRLSEFSNQVADYFQLLTGDDSVECAVRLAVASGRANGVAYRTVARSSGLSPARARYSEDLTPKEGIVRFLLEKGSHGVLFYHDIPRAAAADLFRLTETERHFPHEVASMMAAPINAWDGEDQGLVGILHVTSRRPSAFQPILADSILFVADTLAITLAGVVALHVPSQSTQVSQ